MDDVVEVAGAMLAQARSVVVVTGAGISTDSGIPDFRGPDGVWTKNPGAERMATLDAYLADPDLRARAWQARLHSPAFLAEPNAGHRAVVDLERTGRLHTVITQNIDGLHQKAGTSPERIVEIHGTVHEYECLGCGDRGDIDVYLDRVREGEADPACRVCGGMVKTATISFGQNLVMRDLHRAELAAQECDLMLAVGSTLSVYPAAGVVPVAKQSGARVVIVNGSATDMDSIADVVVRAPISEVLPAMVAALPPAPASDIHQPGGQEQTAAGGPIRGTDPGAESHEDAGSGNTRPIW